MSKFKKVIFFLFILVSVHSKAQKGTQLAGIALNYAPQKSEAAVSAGMGKSKQVSYLVQPFFLHHFDNNQAIGVYGAFQENDFIMLETIPSGTQETNVTESFLSAGGMYRIGNTIRGSAFSIFMQASLGFEIIKRRTQTPLDIKEQPGWGITTALRPGIRYKLTDYFSVEMMIGNFKMNFHRYFNTVQGVRVDSETDFSLNANFDLPTLLIGCSFVLK